MSAATIVASTALLAACVLVVMNARTRRRLARVERCTRALEQIVRGELEPGVRAARSDACAAAAAARDAAIAAGAGPPPPRLPLEPVTGPVVRAVAFGASARRAFAPLRARRRSA